MNTAILEIESKPKTKHKPSCIKWFREIGIEDVPIVAGKTASLGEMFRELTPKGVKVPDGFAITAQAYRDFYAGPASTKRSTIFCAVRHPKCGRAARLRLGDS